MIGDEDEIKDISLTKRAALTQRFQYMTEYYERHDNKLHYVGYFDENTLQPRQSVQLYSWPAEYIGQSHQVQVKESHW
jgi:hypothetical protein